MLQSSAEHINSPTIHDMGR